jgi:ABC-type phosphate/phosphonate transport system substrate-binding protein
MALCRELETVFRRHNIEYDWVLYSGYDAMVDAFVRREIDIAWNGPLSFLKMRRATANECQNLVMRDVDVNFTTQFITHPNSGITTVEDLHGKRFAFGARSSVEAGVLAYHFLKESGIVPQRDLAACTFFDERQTSSLSDQRDVIERVRSREYDAGAVSRRTLEVMEQQGNLPGDEIRAFWSSPGYSHCCFTAHNDLDAEMSSKVTDAFLTVDPNDPVGQAVLEAEACDYFVPGIAEGWDTLEKVAEAEGLI